MALNIGNVNFGLDAQTQGLQKAVAALNRFERQVNKVARSQEKGAKTQVNALSRQEAAIKRAYQQTLQLRQQYQQLGKTPARNLADVTKAFQTLTREMTSGRLSTLEYQRSMEAFNTRIGRSTRQLNLLRKEEREARREGDKFSNTMRNLESATVLAIGPLSGLGARVRSLGAIFGRAEMQTALLIGAFTGMAVALGSMTGAFIRSGVEFEKAMARFEAASGSQAVAARDMLFVINTSKEMGLRIQDNIRSFSRITAAAQGTSLAGKGVQNVFKGISAASAALKLDVLEVEGMFRAIEQMISKGNVQAEELRGQLGERLPGAFQAAARAMNTTTAELGKMLENGEVLAEDLLPKLAQHLEDTYGEAATRNVDSFTGAVNRLSNAWFLLTAQGDQITRASVVATKGINALAGALEWLQDHAHELTRVLMIGTGILVAYTARLAILTGGTILASIARGAVAIGHLTKAIALMNVAAMASPITSLARAFLTLGTVVGGTMLGMQMYERVIGDVDTLLEELEKSASGAGEALLQTFTPPADDISKFTAEIDKLQMRIDAMKEGQLALEQFEAITGPVNDFAEALAEAGIHGEEQIRLVTEYGNKLRQLYALQRDASTLAQDSARAISDSFEELIFSGEKAKDVVKGLIAELIKMTIRAQVLAPFANMLQGTFEGSGFSLPKMFSTPVQNISGGPIAGAKAMGGSVRAGGKYQVNEDGTEWFTPSSNGTITPAGGGGTTNLHITINAPGADAGTEARLREIVMSELAPQIINASTNATIKKLSRPRLV